MDFKKGGNLLNNNIDVNYLKKLSLEEFINLLTNNITPSSKNIIESNRIIYNSEELLLNYISLKHWTDTYKSKEVLNG